MAGRVALLLAVASALGAAELVFTEATTSPLYEQALARLRSGAHVEATTLARLAVAARSEDTFFWPELTLAFLRRTGRGLVESCDEAAGRLTRVAAALVAELRKNELKTEIRKQYLVHQQAEQADEDVVQFHEYAAAAGEAASQVAMGEMHLFGTHGVAVSFERALEWFESAARQGDPRGRALQGFMLEKGFGVPSPSPSEALSLYRAAAEAGDAFALSRLGFAHLHGRLGLPANAQQAEAHLNMATKAGGAQAWVGLGLLARGDDKKAIKFFAVAAQKGSTTASLELAQLLLKDASQCPTALLHLQHVVDWSNPVLQLLDRASRLVRARNVSAALALYEQLAWAGNEEAQANAAYLFHRHPLVRDMDKALRYYQLSAEQGNAHSHLMLGDYHYAANNLNLSHTAYRRASDLHHYEAMFNLGYMYQFGEGTPKDAHLAKRYYDLALATNPAAFYAVMLALLYLHVTTFSVPQLVVAQMGILFAWWSDTVVMALLVVILSALLVVRVVGGG